MGRQEVFYEMGNLGDRNSTLCLGFGRVLKIGGLVAGFVHPMLQPCAWV